MSPRHRALFFMTTETSPWYEMDLGLPYDGTPPPEDPPLPPRDEPEALDRPLSDYPYQPAVPDHVKSLMGRMSRGKVYLLEESTGIIHADDEDRLRGNPVSPFLMLRCKG